MRPAPPVRVCLYGLGAIGKAVARALTSTPGTEIVGAIDTDPRKVGRTLQSALRIKRSTGAAVRISDDPEKVFRRTSPHAVIHCTGSRLIDVAPSLETIIDAGLPCITSCEEMALPDLTDPKLARRLDRRARGKRVAVLGAGVNPGFAMDALALALSGVTRNVESVSVERVLDPLSRRGAFQKKVGIGMSFGQARRLVEAGRMGHVGLKHSAMLVARGLGWTISDVQEDLRILRSSQGADAAVTGLRQTVTARNGSKRLISLKMLTVAGVKTPHDAITIKAEPELRLWIRGGIPGDQATVASLINGMGQILASPMKGLLTILDLPLRPAWSQAAS